MVDDPFSLLDPCETGVKNELDVNNEEVELGSYGLIIESTILDGMRHLDESKTDEEAAPNTKKLKVNVTKHKVKPKPMPKHKVETHDAKQKEEAHRAQGKKILWNPTTSTWVCKRRLAATDDRPLRVAIVKPKPMPKTVKAKPMLCWKATTYSTVQ